MDLKLKNEVRAFELKQFRNIGYGDNSEENSTLILNYSLNPEYMGDLVILIGPNNSGKSNVLDALICFAKQSISKRDFSDTKLEGNEQNPSLKLFASNQPNINIYEYDLSKNSQLIYKEGGKIVNAPLFDLNIYAQSLRLLKKQEFQNELNLIANFLRNYGLIPPNSQFLWNNINQQNNLMLDEQYVKGNLLKIQNLLKNLFQNRNKYPNYDNFIKSIIDNSNAQMYNFLTNYEKYLNESENLNWLPKNYQI